MSRRTKVCIVAPVHEWDDVRVFSKQAVTLVQAGYDVVLLAQAGEAFERKGVRVEPVRAPRTPRSVRFLALPFLFRQAVRRRADVYHLHNPDTLPLAMGLKLLGKKVIYDTHEDFAERIRLREWIPSPLRSSLGRVISWLEKVAAGVVDACVATEDAVAERLGEGAVVIGNAPRLDRDLMAEVEAFAAAIVDRFVGLRVVYVGWVGVARGLLEMVDAIEMANVSAPVRLWLIGPADEDGLVLARARSGWRYVDYLERLPQEKALSYAVRADVGLIALRDVGGHRRSDPNKIYEYMALGIPFIASDFPAWRSRLQGYDAGWFVLPGDAEALAAAILAARDEDARHSKGQAGLKFVKTYNWERESEKLLALYASLSPA